MNRRAPYDLIAAQWSSARNLSSFREKRYVDLFLASLPGGGRVVDLGCGTGKPIAEYLLSRGCRVVGIDASLEMLRIARAHCPAAEFVQAEIESLDLRDEHDGIVAWDSIFHVPKACHASVFRLLWRWLKPGSPLLLSLGGSDDEFVDIMFEVEFFYSSHAPAVSLALLKEAGFAIELAEIDDPSSRGHLAILCRKRHG
jgi:SAM-dependent methyltransferase